MAVAAVVSVMLVAGLPVMPAILSFEGIPAPVIIWPIAEAVIVPAEMETIVLRFVVLPVAEIVGKPFVLTGKTMKSVAQLGVAVGSNVNGPLRDTWPGQCSRSQG